MITLQNLTLQRGKKVLFDHVNLSIFAKQKVGLVGINGSGKTSLFAMMRGELSPDAGNLSIPTNCQISYLSQDVPNSDMPATTYVTNGDKELTELLTKLKQAEESHDHHKISEAHERLYEIDGYAADSRAKQLLNGLGFSSNEFEKPVNEFSGGWRMRLNLARVLMSRADLLLLDEPTNHLDLETIAWLERWLKKFEGTLLLISHDREFLDHVVNKIVNIHGCKMDMYTGNYSDFERMRAEKLLQEQAMYEKQQAQIAHMTSYVERFRYKASKARQAQSRLKALEKMAVVNITHINSPFSFKFKEPARCSPPLLTLEDMGFAYDDKNVFKKVNFNLSPGDRIGLLGPNGAGKSTLIKLLSGSLQPQVGKCVQHKGLKIGYYAQHQVDQLKLHESAFSHIANLEGKAREQEIRNFLGGFNFNGDRCFESIETFSGGEKARLVLAILVWQKPNLLLLDEPTNHLDLDMREALTDALTEYTGALVLVSHDRHLLRTAVDELYLVHDLDVTPFENDIDEYQNWFLKQKDAQSETVEARPKPSKRRVKNVSKQLEKIDKKLSDLYTKKKYIEVELAENEMYNDKNKHRLTKLLLQLEEMQCEIDSLEDQWCELDEMSVGV